MSDTADVAAGSVPREPVPTAALTKKGLPPTSILSVAVPALFVDAGERAAFSVIEFFTAHIRNPNTRAAYSVAVRDFGA